MYSWSGKVSALSSNIELRFIRLILAILQFLVYSREPVCFVTISYISCKVTKNFFRNYHQIKSIKSYPIEGCSVSKITIPLFTLHVSPICGVVTSLFPLSLSLPSSLFRSPLSSPILLPSPEFHVRVSWSYFTNFHRVEETRSPTDLCTVWHVPESKG